MIGCRSKLLDNPDLLLDARPLQPHPAPVDVAAVVTATADLLKSDPDVSRVATRWRDDRTKIERGT